ncbi:MAG: hypothetical protein M3Y28_06105 [Armatimonadota bacterium]|nr:hypothetical protein [Armatimonadota bacterium]
MLYVFTGSAQSEFFWEAVKSQGGCVFSPCAAAVVLHCSPEHIHQMIFRGELEAWAYCAEEGAAAEHYRVLIP